MIGPILACLEGGVILIFVGWILGHAAANSEYRRHREQEQQNAQLRSIRQDLASLQREQQRLATWLKL